MQKNSRPGCRWLGGLFFAGLAGLSIFMVVMWGVGTAVYQTITADLPAYADLSQENDTVPSQPTQILAWSDARQQQTVVINEIVDPLNGRRQWLPLDQIPTDVVNAMVAFVEPGLGNGSFTLWQADQQFIAFLAGEKEPETLPLVQQLIRDQLLLPEQSGIQSKLEELLLTHRAASLYSREQILEWYLNTHYYGNLAFGIEAAAHVYFAKPAADLTLAEAALLVGATPIINPFDAPDQAKIEQETVLAAMVEAGQISQGGALAAQVTPIQLAERAVDRQDIIAPHFAKYVRDELEHRFGPALLLTGGLQVYTPLNLEMQGQAECAARVQINRLSGQMGPALPADELAACQALDFMPPVDTAVLGIDQSVNNAAIIVMDAKTAEIRAMVGSINYWDDAIDGSFNVAVNGRRQPGTAFTPFTYLTALSQGYTAATMVLDVPSDFSTAVSPVAYQPQNADGQFHGPMRLRQALGNDYFVPAVQIASWVGMDRIVSTARSLGITTLDTAPHSYDLSLNLGGGGVSLLDMTYAYTVLANMGVMMGQSGTGNGRPIDPVAIVRVENQAGDVLYDYYQQVQQRDILTPQLAYLMNDMLADRSARCAAFGCPNVMELPANRPAAVKTGTTNDFRDAWTIGYTPQLVTGVWVGNSDNRAMAGVTGISGAAPIWQAVMAWALQDEPVAIWAQPPGMVETAVCDTSGLLATDICPTDTELFIQGTQPTVYDTIYQEFAVNRETGRLATIYTPSGLVENRIYKVYPEAAAAWAEENGIEQPPTEYDTISLASSSSADAQITFPQPLAVISGTVTILGTARGADFSYYRVAYFPGLIPATLQSIAENVTEPQTNGPLAVWDTGNLNGLYTVLLTVVDGDGRFQEVTLPVTIEN
ncbi:MAG: transglycosylase domain-containing protein [Ardenticatenaceae bacterium]|nr:transglycosylase domain-containing protein [Ardenticatenaceae bacterium]MCB9444590.1 transglycosylase domain-containing protein [Ardenticatenaceae bacterium]